MRLNKTPYEVDGRKYMVVDTKAEKVVIGRDFHSVLNKNTGYFVRWGATREDDPDMNPIGPEILDIEISVNGCPQAGVKGGCRACYKNNTAGEPVNMSLETFKQIIDKFPKTLGQVAIGVTGIQTNPDFIPMMRYCREIGIAPNFTLSGIDLTQELAIECAKLVGALAVSCYQTDKNICYNTIKTFLDLGVRQTNMHLMVSNETLPFCYEVLEDIQNDERLTKLNAVVFLTCKPKGRAKGHYTAPNQEQYNELVKFCLERNIRFGFDSCSAARFVNSLDSLNIDEASKRKLIECAESCESDLFSSYVNVNGEFWHCSFTENEPGYQPVNMLAVEDFQRDVWYAEPVKRFREKLLATCVLKSSKGGCRQCPVYSELQV